MEYVIYLMVAAGAGTSCWCTPWCTTDTFGMRVFVTLVIALVWPAAMAHDLFVHLNDRDCEE